MVQTKGKEAAVRNWKAAQGSVPAKYKTGVEANTTQNERAIASEDLWKARVAEAAASGARVKGLQKSSTEAWKRAAASKGASRIAAGMAEAEPQFREGIGRVIDTIESTSIGARSADPMSNVDARVKPIVKALYDMKRR